MASLTTFNYLSSFKPLEVKYEFFNKENLAYNITRYNNLLQYYKYSIFDGFKDLSISKHNILCLTDNITLPSVFEKPLTEINYNQIGTSFYLQTRDGNYLQISNNNNNLYIGSALSGYRPLLLSVIPQPNGTSLLHVANKTKLEISKTYPYYVYPSIAELSNEHLYRQEFILNFLSTGLTLKVKTDIGYRYISYGPDNMSINESEINNITNVRATGLILASKIISDYVFTPIFVTPELLNVGFDATNNEVQYFNNFNTSEKDYDLEIKNSTSSNTNLLISAPLNSNVNKNNSIPINISLLKTNFTSSETYSVQ